MPLVLRKVQGRSKPRFFTTCAVGRIAFNCREDTGATNDEIMLCVSKALGISQYSKDVSARKNLLRNFLTEVISNPGAFATAGFVREAEVLTLTATETAATSFMIRVSQIFGVAFATLVLSFLFQLLTAPDFVSVSVDEELKRRQRECKCKFNNVIPNVRTRRG